VDPEPERICEPNTQPQSHSYSNTQQLGVYDGCRNIHGIADNCDNRFCLRLRVCIPLGLLHGLGPPLYECRMVRQFFAILLFLWDYHGERIADSLSYKYSL
jgi:hypothetical protein